MRKLLSGITAAFLAVSLTACAQEKKEEAPAMPEDMVLIRVNTEGIGYVEMAEAGQEIEWDEEYPSTSIARNVEKGTEYILGAKAEEGFKFIKWKKDNADYSAEETAEITADEPAEYIAVFGMDSGYDGEAAGDISEVQVIGDILALPSYGSGYTDKIYVAAFELNGTLYRVSADLDEETAGKLFELSYDDPERDQKEIELIKDLPVTRIDNLSEAVPSEEELAGYEGKVISDLLQEDWIVSGYDSYDMVCFMVHGVNAYRVSVEGEFDNSADNPEEAVRNMKVVHMEYNGVGDIFIFD